MAATTSLHVDHPRPTGLHAVLRPTSVAVIGASSDPASVGHQILRRILDGGYTGTVHPVHPTARAVLGFRASPSVLDVPHDIDLAIVAVPAAVVPKVAEECGRKGVRGMVVVSAGFKEIGPEGAAREAELLAIVRRYGIRLIGPNCIGVVNASPEVRLNATFGPRPPPFGGTAIMAQSGALGVAALEYAVDLKLGIAQFVSLGNKADVSGNDLLTLWEHDPEVRQILLYLESFGNPRNFLRIARRVARGKPVIAVKAGRSREGARAAATHTGALAAPDRFVDALFDQCGVVRAETIEELFDYALAFGLMPLPSGGRVAIVTNSGGPSILATDALEAAGLTLADFDPSTLAAVRRVLPANSALQNPIDLLAAADGAGYRAALEATLADPHVDGALAIYTPTALHDERSIAAAFIAAHEAHVEKPLLAVFLGPRAGGPATDALAAAGVPAYGFPENAVRALGAMKRLADHRARGDGTVPALEVDTAAASRILATARERGDVWLPTMDAFALLRAYGLPVVPARFVRTAQEAAAAAQAIGFPVVLKVEASGLVHKTEVGAVRLRLADPVAVTIAFNEATASVRSHGFEPSGALVMAQAESGREMLLGLQRDPKFGPAVALGLGGVHAEVYRDVVYRLVPLTDLDAPRMIECLRGRAILDAHRGEPAADLDALGRAVLRLGRLAEDFPEIASLDVNPLIVHPEGRGATLVDARVHLGGPP